jgi:cystathionine beta-synthase
LAMVSIIKGYECVLAVTSKSSTDKIDMLRAMGATIYVCPANVSPQDTRSYYQVAKRLNNEIKDSIYINQYFNDLNTEAHYMTTGKEIWEQSNGKITHLVACSGTGGTISGCAKFLKEKNPKIKIIGVDAYGSVLKKFHETKELDLNEIYPYRITGIGKNLIPSTTYFDLIDHFEKVTDEESAHRARKVTSSEGILVGYTTGAAMQALYQLNKKKYFNKKSRVVIIFPDHGSRYMSQIYNENWMENQGFMNSSVNHPQKIEYIDNTSEKK